VRLVWTAYIIHFLVVIRELCKERTLFLVLKLHFIVVIARSEGNKPVSPEASVPISMINHLALSIYAILVLVTLCFFCFLLLPHTSHWVVQLLLLCRGSQHALVSAVLERRLMICEAPADVSLGITSHVGFGPWRFEKGVCLVWD